MKEKIVKFIYHSYRKSIAILLSKFLLFENYILDNDSFDPLSSNENTDNKKELFNIRNELIEKIFYNLTINGEREKIYSIVLKLIDIIETIIIKWKMKNGRFFNTLFSNLNIDLNSVENINNLQIKSNYSEILSLLTYMISNSQIITKPK